MKPLSLNQARESVGVALFGSNWIGTLTDDEAVLRSQFLRRRKVRMLDGDGSVELTHAEPYPLAQARKLENAVGRFVLLDAQYATVDSWLSDRGFPLDRSKPIDRRGLRKAIKQQTPQEITSRRKRGPQPREADRLLAVIKDAIKDGLSDIELCDMPDKELMVCLGGKRERCRAALAKYFEEKRTSTNSDKK